MIQRPLATYLLLCALFLTIAGSVHMVAFSLQSSRSAPSIQPIQQGIPGLGVSGQQEQPATLPQPLLPEQQQVPPPRSPSLPPSSSTPPSPLSPLPEITQEQQQQQQGANEGIIAHGIIDSLIFTPSAAWIATGNWTIGVNNGAVALVTANMTWYNDNGTASHTHEILNFKPIGGELKQPIIVQPEDNNLSLRGVVDVGANHRIVWNDVQSAIDIKKGGKILSILLSDAQTNDHFGGRPIFGIVTSFTRCSDVPGPNMEIPPACLDIPSPRPTVTAPPPTAAPTVSPPPTIVTNNTIQGPTNNFTASSPPPLSSLPPANITTNRPPSLAPPPASNATGKSPFDILGGG